MGSVHCLVLFLVDFVGWFFLLSFFFLMFRVCLVFIRKAGHRKKLAQTHVLVLGWVEQTLKGYSHQMRRSDQAVWEEQVCLSIPHSHRHPNTSSEVLYCVFWGVGLYFLSGRLAVIPQKINTNTSKILRNAWNFPCPEEKTTMQSYPFP